MLQFSADQLNFFFFGINHSNIDTLFQPAIFAIVERVLNEEYKTENSNLKSRLASIQHEQALSSADYNSTNFTTVTSHLLNI
ncbi:hypothetical protein BpHYR1_003906 [Brachionus plicatilis]|uniref:Uncharacterized protein n=1 Tax=Brachionus plicatilis TaxID=10195 RepID=A0A3M7T1A0_BRAPC|nr:hypothetical protein BpHYR1_003906 [Brachionus plicatilis]